MYGVAGAIAHGYQLRFERHLHHPIEKVWAALTQPEHLIAWLAEAEVELVPGGRVQLQWVNTPERHVARGSVTAVDPPTLVEYDTDIHGRLRWELAPEPGGCRLIFTCELQCPREDLASCLAGWHIHLDHLADALEGQRVDWPSWMADHWPRWTQYHDHYAAELGR